MNSARYILLLVVLFLNFTTLNAQTNPVDENGTQTINEGSVNDQFEFLLRKSGNFRGTNGQMYEAVSRNMLLNLQSNTTDSLKTIQSKLDNTRATVTTQQTEINDLKSNLGSTQSTLDATNLEKNNMSLLGMSMSKTSYNILMWSVIAGLLVLLIIFIIKFKSSNAITKAANKSLKEIDEEFEEHRRTALEREQKVRRQLQDEINKQKGTT